MAQVFDIINNIVENTFGQRSLHPFFFFSSSSSDRACGETAGFREYGGDHEWEIIYTALQAMTGDILLATRKRGQENWSLSAAIRRVTIIGPPLTKHY